jgi:hypothetical protein
VCVFVCVFAKCKSRNIPETPTRITSFLITYSRVGLYMISPALRRARPSISMTLGGWNKNNQKANLAEAQICFSRSPLQHHGCVA